MKETQQGAESNGRGAHKANAALPPGEAAAHEIRQYHPQRVLIVALDIGKDVHHVYIRTGAYEEIVAPMKIASLASGYQQVIELLDALLASGNYDLVLLGHEPTGVYHEAWSHALLTHYQAQRRGTATPVVRYRVLNPMLVKQERQRKTHRQRKRDTIDGLAIAELLGQGVGHAGQIWSFAGFDPIISETGNSKVQGKISYKGCPYLRATLYQIGFMAAQHCPACRACYERARQRHPSQTRALIHVANKANRILFALLRDQQPYSVELAQRV